MRDLLLIGFLFVAIYYSFKRPYLGMAAWVWIALTAPASWAFGISSSFRLNLTIVLITALSYMMLTKNKKFPKHSLFFWLGFFAFWTTVSTIFNLSVVEGKTFDYWNEFFKTYLLFFFIALTVTKRLHVDTIVWAIVLSISSYAGMEAVKFILSGGGHKIVGKAGIIADRNDLAVAINMAIPLIIYLFQTSKNQIIKYGLLGLLGLNVIAIVGTYSRGGFIGLVILGVAFWLTSRHKVVLMLLALLALPALYSVAPEDWRDRQDTVVEASESDGSFIGRLWAWKISTLIALDNPLTGGGFRAVTDPVLWLKYAPKTPNFGIIKTPPIPYDKAPKAAHNVYMQVLGDHGFVGLFVFLVILTKVMLTTRRMRKIAKREGVEWVQKLSSAITLTMVGFCITGGNVSLAYFDLLYAVIGIVTVMSLNNLACKDPANAK
jgi:probable O-glycosylation ligase (exosortase A-associated)